MERQRPAGIVHRRSIVKLTTSDFGIRSNTQPLHLRCNAAGPAALHACANLPIHRLALLSQHIQVVNIRLNPAKEIRQILLFIRAVDAVVGEGEAEHNGVDAELLL